MLWFCQDGMFLEKKEVVTGGREGRRRKRWCGSGGCMVVEEEGRKTRIENKTNKQKKERKI